jgi:hypothetical protein
VASLILASSQRLLNAIDVAGSLTDQGFDSRSTRTAACWPRLGIKACTHRVVERDVAIHSASRTNILSVRSGVV